MKERTEEISRAELRTAASAHLRSLPLNHCFGVSLTLKQHSDGITLDDIRASQNLRHFMNSLNCEVFGQRFKRFGIRLNIVPVIEKSSTGRLHYHLILQNPFPDTPTRFEAMIEQLWSKTHFGFQQTHVHYQIDHGWADYITKFKTASDRVDWENYHWS